MADDRASASRPTRRRPARGGSPGLAGGVLARLQALVRLLGERLRLGTDVSPIVDAALGRPQRALSLLLAPLRSTLEHLFLGRHLTHASDRRDGSRRSSGSLIRDRDSVVAPRWWLVA